jgi:asparagine synthase (glutamine-hydrolysing)
MCGIVAVFNFKSNAETLRPGVLLMSRKIRHRGPDWSGIYSDTHAVLAHERLAIVDPQSGGQPLFNPDKNLILAVNGEIYNHQQIR